MARLAVLHNTLDLRGGADAVCVRACAALAERHDVTLFTVSRADPAAVAADFGVSLDVPGDVRVASPPLADAVAGAFARAAPRIGPQLPARSTLLRAFFRRHADEYDLAVSTANEFALSLPSLQYVHFPQFHGRRTPRADPGTLDPLWSRLAGPTPGAVGDDAHLLANSAWTADTVASIYGRRPAVLHPPVAPVAGRAWADREPGVLVLGRIAPDKRTLDAIRVADAVRERGHDLRFHVVGTAAPAYRDYVERVRSAAAERPYLAVETDADRERVETLLGRYRYGLNAKPDEHFGMAVAEYVAAGMVAFAPDSGGQRDVLAGDERLLFDGVEERPSGWPRPSSRD
ncbi:glycosyltransferase [Halosegnis marinus]|uniref:glycosyltransferase n=1 Tax=Halosegnis marinus TaxID=3034023 RepID=UPI0036120CAD